MRVLQKDGNEKIIFGGTNNHGKILRNLKAGNWGYLRGIEEECEQDNKTAN
jgi:hypothetical protein